MLLHTGANAKNEIFCTAAFFIQVEVVEGAPEDADVLAVGIEVHSSCSSVLEGGSPGPSIAECNSGSRHICKCARASQRTKTFIQCWA